MDDTAVARLHYAEEIKFRGQISSLGVLRAFAAVPRELFLHEGPWRIRCDVAPEYWSTADADPVHVYHDVLIAIDERRKLDNGLPSLWARLFDLLDLKANERVVQIGCGLGYYSAILSDLVGPGGKVVAIDCEEAFVRRARRNLRAWENVEVVHGDGCEDVGGPADVIIVHAGFTHPHPLWLKSLRPKGRLLVPLTTKDRQGTLVKITQQGDGYCAEAVGGIEIFPCHGRTHTDIDERLTNWWETMSALAPFRFRSLDEGLPSDETPLAHKAPKRAGGNTRAAARPRKPVAGNVAPKIAPAKPS
ncbi:MAG: methyltransferase domain-containing protein [Beijerinckiaceae bacterium]